MQNMEKYDAHLPLKVLRIEYPKLSSKEQSFLDAYTWKGPFSTL